MAENKETRKCLGFNRECDEQVSVGSKSGLCKKCYANKNYAEHHPSAKRQLKAAPAKTLALTNGGNGHARPINGKISIQLSENALNHLMIALPPDAKANMFAWWAEGING